MAEARLCRRSADRSETATSTVLSIAEEAIIVAFRRHTLLPLDDCLYALQATIPHLTRSSLHRCLQRHGISACRRSRATDRTSASSRHTRSATSTSTSPRCAPKRASSICSSRSTEPPSSPCRAAREGRSAYRRALLGSLDRRRAVPASHRAHG